jgi:hypothetical protein
MFKSLRILGLAAAFALASIPSFAAVLWYGGEDTSMTAVGTVDVMTASNGFRSAFARTSLNTSNSTTVADPPANRWASPQAATPCSNPCWIHAMFQVAGATAAGTLNQQALIVRSPDGVGRIVLRQTGTAGTLKFTKRNAAGTLTDLSPTTGSGTFASATGPSDVPIQMDLEIIYGCTSGDTINLYYNSVLALSFTGASICTDAATSLGAVDLAAMGNGALLAANVCYPGAGETCWSEVILASEDTRSMSLATLTTGTSGATQNCTPNTPANVNKVAITDTSFVSTSSNNVICEFGGLTSPPAGIWGVKSVSMELRNLISTTGPQNLKYIAHVSGSDYSGLSGCSNPTMTTAFANYRCQMDLSPATGLVWGISEVFNSGSNLYSFGFESLM